MAYSMTTPGSVPGSKEMPDSQRLARSAQAAEVTSAAVMVAADQIAAEAGPIKTSTAARPWERSVPKGAGTKRRLPLEIMPTALRAKLEYLESVSDSENMSDIASAGILAECMRIEKDHGLLPEIDAAKVRSRVVDKQETSLEGYSRTVLMIAPNLHQRMETLKQMRFVSTLTKLALAGIEDECNRRLKARGEL